MNKEIYELFDRESDERIKNGIERHRKGNFTVTVTDKNGAPVKNALLKIKQTGHEFRFGANIFMLDEFDNKEYNEIYKQKFRELFNMATLPFYWDTLEPEEGNTRYDKNSPKIYRRPAPGLCLDFCEKYGIEPREHALCYSNLFPKWLKGKSVFDCKRALVRRMAEISARYADKIRTIEVTNEMYWDESATALYDDPDYVEWCFKTAEKYFPANQLCINEWTGTIWDSPGRTSDRYYMQIENALLKGARIDAVGMQFHMFFRREEYFRKTRKCYDPHRLFKILDLYARFNLPIQITEITIPSYTQQPQDEELQAIMLEKLYSLWFSHPAVEQIIYWNLADGYAASASPGNMDEGENYYRGGLLRFDLSEKPSYKTLKKLVSKDWNTDLTAITDEAGQARFSAFYGDYTIKAAANGREKTTDEKLGSDSLRSVAIIL